MGFSAEDRETLLDLIYDGVADPALWDEVLARIVTITGSSGGLIQGVSFQSKDTAFLYEKNLDPECRRRNDQFHIMNPWVEVMIRKRVGELVRSDEIRGLSDLQSTGFYADVLHPQQIAHSVMTSLAIRPNKFHVAFNMMRGEREGPYCDSELALISSFLPHLNRATELKLRSFSYRAVAHAEFEVLDLLKTGVILLDHSGYNLYANKAALEIMVRQDSAFQLKGRSEFKIASQDESDHFHALIANALNGGRGGAMRITDDAKSFVVFVIPLRGQTARHLHDAKLSKRPAIMLALIDLTEALTPAAESLTRHYDLTPGETRAALAIASAGSVQAAAQALGLGVNTLKTHTHRVYAKTGLGSVAELTKLMTDLSLPVNLELGRDAPFRP